MTAPIPQPQPVSEHTPTPWRIRDDFGGGWIQGSPQAGETYGDRVANLAKPRTVGVANAAFIVEAVNSHASLKAKVEDRELVIDLLESNARIQAKLLADTGRRVEELEARVIALEQVISEEMYPENCDDDANRMLLESAIDSHDRRIKTRAGLQPKGAA